MTRAVSYLYIESMRAGGTLHRVLSLFSRQAQDILASRALLIYLGLAVLYAVILPLEELAYPRGGSHVLLVFRLPFIYITGKTAEERPRYQYTLRDGKQYAADEHIYYCDNEYDGEGKAVEAIHAVSAVHKPHHGGF